MSIVITTNMILNNIKNDLKVTRNVIFTIADIVMHLVTTDDKTK